METTEICKKVFGAKLINAEYLNEYVPPKCECPWHYVNDAVKLTFDNGKILVFTHKQDCCESVHFSSSDYPIADMIGDTVTKIEMRTECNDHNDENMSETWSFIYIHTTKDVNVLKWQGSSNGWYSETPDWIYEDEAEDEEAYVSDEVN